jgi:hypothetical protein
MTEREWLACADPLAMLRVVLPEAPERKQRLFALACARRVLDLIPDGPSRVALDVAERFADRRASAEELRAASREAFRETDT